MAKQGFTLTSPVFSEGTDIPREYTCDGQDISPELNWMHAPQGTQSFALIVDDPDAPNGTFTHWVLFNIPGNLQGLPRGSRNIGTGGRNDFQSDRYGGPCPPPNHGRHRYFFTLHALDVPVIDLPEGTHRPEVEKEIAAHSIGSTQLMGIYERKTG